ncbi:hypothetical protein FTO70_12340 [Methanosarcina sp. KYL-1]|uniref:YIP1 family protein n=1 Tax=Methanosarcina sp. KYL-1 TaxID=2602068 RepID=UPI0021009CBB|nr:YIP1 family protein [Methanosarcina sp. KYL-1]MCQ1536446.1 hypothetical protein [Methanosarcina sp. KYL-1]
MDYIEIWKGVIQSPSEFYRKMPKAGGYADPITFAAISFAVYGLLTVLFNRGMYGGGMYGGREFSFFMVPAAVIITPIFGVISLFIEAAILHVIFKVLGGSGTYEGTVRFIAYATAILLLSWIPFIGWIFGLYGIYLYIVGGSFVHNVSMGRAAIAVLLPTVLLLLLVVVLAVLAGLLYSSVVI